MGSNNAKFEELKKEPSQEVVKNEMKIKEEKTKEELTKKELTKEEKVKDTKLSPKSIKDINIITLDEYQLMKNKDILCGIKYHISKLYHDTNKLVFVVPNTFIKIEDFCVDSFTLYFGLYTVQNGSSSGRSFTWKYNKWYIGEKYYISSNNKIVMLN